MSDQKINVDLTADSSRLVAAASKASEELSNISAETKTANQHLGRISTTNRVAANSLQEVVASSKDAVTGIENVGNAANQTAENVSKAEQTIAKSINQIYSKLEKVKSFKHVITEFKSGFDLLKTAVNFVIKPFQELAKKLQEIDSKASNLGTTAEYFQKLERNSEACGAKMEDVSEIFKKINDTAKRAFTGDGDARKKLNDIGIAIDDIKGKSPEEIFEFVARALASAGDEALISEAAFALCGDKLLDIKAALSGIADTDARISADEIVPNEAVAAATKMADSWADIKDAMLVIVSQAGVPKLFEMMAAGVQALSDSIIELKSLLPKNNTAGAKPQTPAWRRWWANHIDWAGPGLLVNPFLDPSGKGRSLGEILLGVEPTKYSTGPATPEELAQFASRRPNRKQREAYQAQAEQTRIAIKEGEQAKAAEQTAKIAAEIEYAKMSPDQRRLADFEKQLQESLERLKKMGASDEQLADYERIRRNEYASKEFEEQYRKRAAEAARLSAQRQREAERAASANTRLAAQRKREAERAASANARNSKKSKHKKTHSRHQERTEAQPLSTAGSISDPKQARIQRSHELKLAKETAKQKINIKVKTKGTKAGTIAKAITSAIGGLLHSADSHLSGIQSNLGNLRPVSPATLSSVHQVARAKAVKPRRRWPRPASLAANPTIRPVSCPKS